jgi:hypothetical protein
MKEKKYKKTKIALLIVIFLLIVFLLELCSLLVRQNVYNRYVDHIHTVLSIKTEILAAISKHEKTPLTINEVSLIQSWMTFDYINHLFILPQSYLQTDLGITDPHYPRLALEDYAEYTHVHQNVVVSEVQNAVRNYLLKN